MTDVRERVGLRVLGRIDYARAMAAMRDYTERRDAHTLDELWLLEHPPVYTLGLKAHAKAIASGGIPVIATDRGGDVTYHGPGQPIVYVLMDLNRRRWGIHRLVTAIEQAVIDLLAGHGVAAERRAGAPGVYVDRRKIAALGLRVRRGASYHGVALNVRMDLAPFGVIDPCGYPGLGVTQLADFVPGADPAMVGTALLDRLAEAFGYTARIDHGNTLPAPSGAATTTP